MKFIILPLYVPPKFIYWNIITNVIILRDGTFRRWLNHQAESSPKWALWFHNRRYKEHPNPFCPATALPAVQEAARRSHPERGKRTFISKDSWVVLDFAAYRARSHASLSFLDYLNVVFCYESSSRLRCLCSSYLIV